MATTTTVPVSDPSHPSHQSWLQILMAVLNAAIAIAPAVVQIVDPGDAKEAEQIGNLASGVTASIGGVSRS